MGVLYLEKNQRKMQFHGVGVLNSVHRTAVQCLKSAAREVFKPIQNCETISR